MNGHSHKVRLSVDCSVEERRKIKIFCAMQDKALSEWIMDCVRERMRRMEQHLPNAETLEALRMSEPKEEVVSFKAANYSDDDQKA